MACEGWPVADLAGDILLDWLNFKCNLTLLNQAEYLLTVIK